MMKNNRDNEEIKIIRAVFTVALSSAFTLLLLSCNEDVPVAEPFAAPSAVATRVSVEKLDAGVKEVVILGGRLYDDWFDVVTSAAVPADDNLMAKFFEGYPATSAGTPYGDFLALDGLTATEKPEQYRCSTCHGFKYAGSKFGPGGIMNAADTMTLEEIQAVIKDGFTLSFGTQTETVHNFGALGLTNTRIAELANFVKYGVVYVEDYFHPFSPKGTLIGNGDLINGTALYSGDGRCSGCHGDEGKDAFEPGESAGTIGQDEPAEMLHKIRFGQPSKSRKTSMPTIYDSGLTTQDAVDIMTYTQKLPR